MMPKQKRMRHQYRKKAGKVWKNQKDWKQYQDLNEKLKREDEDILKFIYEENSNKVTCDKLKQAFKNINNNYSKILKRLLDEDLIVKSNGFYILTTKGKEIAELIFIRHIEIEEYIKSRSRSCDAHEMAHILEHELKEVEIKKMIKASVLKDKGICLNDFKLPEGTIVDVNLENCKVWTKLISIGIFPGQRIQILSRSKTNYLIEVKHSKLAINRILAEGILLIP